ncbi:unnamed protein product [Mytilus coruscus]|uniref:Uncharacterized protein n=1 Tax=Mytilus coruscus TaxID=42192 RepID=A0A6J8AJA0_MYTCO|nr:unnamed protein product [Mytilus coruscus]
MQSLLDDGLLQLMLIQFAVDTNIGNCSSEIKMFISIEILTKQERLSHRKRKNKQAHLLAIQKQIPIQDITLNRLQTLTTSNGDIVRGCCVTPENHLVLTHSSESKISLADFHGSCIASISIEYGDSNDVTCLENPDVVVPSGHSDNCGLDIIIFPSRKRAKFIQLPGRPYCLASTDEKMFLCCTEHGYISNK